MSERRVNIVGVGNLLMGDDGVGPAVVARLTRRGVPDGVFLHDAGLAVGDVLGRLDPGEALVVVDAVRGGGAPGDVYRLRVDVRALDADADAGLLSLHELSVLPALRLEALTGRVFSDVTVLGVEPAVVEWGEGLSPVVAGAAERVVEQVLAHVAAEPALEPAATRRNEE